MIGLRIAWEHATMVWRSLRTLGEIAAMGAILAASVSGLTGTKAESEDDSETPAASPAAITTASRPPSLPLVEVPVAAPESEAGATEKTPPKGTLPANLLQLPESAESALVFDLESNRMYVFTVDDGEPRQLGDYFVAVGKQGIEKQREGDEKTPVGLYFIESFIPDERLPPIYGVGAFPIDYPNAWDRRLGRTGSGIWIHGTDKDDDSLLPLSSRGCLTLRNVDFLTLKQSARIRYTPVIVAKNVRWSDLTSLASERASLADAVETWRQDWESLSTDAYLSHYSSTFRTDRMDLGAWSRHKRRVNSRKSFIRVSVTDVGIYEYPGEDGLFLVTFEQRYRSSNFRGRTWKHQYWRREDGTWRIVHESSA